MLETKLSLFSILYVDLKFPLKKIIFYTYYLYLLWMIMRNIVKSTKQLIWKSSKKNALNKWKYSNDDSIVLFSTYYSDYKYFQCCINDKVQNGTVQFAPPVDSS